MCHVLNGFEWFWMHQIKTKTAGSDVAWTSGLPSQNAASNVRSPETAASDSKPASLDIFELWFRPDTEAHKRKLVVLTNSNWTILTLLAILQLGLKVLHAKDCPIVPGINKLQSISASTLYYMYSTHVCVGVCALYAYTSMICKMNQNDIECAYCIPVTGTQNCQSMHCIHPTLWACHTIGNDPRSRQSQAHPWQARPLRCKVRQSQILIF